MFRHRQRRPPFADFINWTDYRWDPMPQAPGPVRGPWGRPRQHGLDRILLAGIAVLVGVKLLSSYRNYRGSWLGRALIGALVLAVFAALRARAPSSRRSHPSAL